MNPYRMTAQELATRYLSEQSIYPSDTGYDAAHARLTAHFGVAIAYAREVLNERKVTQTVTSGDNYCHPCETSYKQVGSMLSVLANMVRTKIATDKVCHPSQAVPHESRDITGF